MRPAGVVGVTAFGLLIAAGAIWSAMYGSSVRPRAAAQQHTVASTSHRQTTTRPQQQPLVTPQRSWPDGPVTDEQLARAFAPPPESMPPEAQPRAVAIHPSEQELREWLRETQVDGVVVK